MNCCKNGSTCPHCDPGIEAFYQEKIKKAKEAVVYLKTTGVEMHYEDLLDAKDIWYEYCELKRQEKMESEESIPDEVYNLKDSW